ncbi:MAG: hypothetical protein ACP5KV_04825 [Candidatus Methanomethylicaceae archaeon]
MRQATSCLVGSCKDVISAYSELQENLKGLKRLVGKPGQRRSYERLKEIGLALILTPTPEPFSDVIGASILAFAKYLERRSPPLTLSDLRDELQKTLRNLHL